MEGEAINGNREKYLTNWDLSVYCYMEPINVSWNFKFTATGYFQNTIRVVALRTDGKQGNAYLQSRIIMAVLHTAQVNGVWCCFIDLMLPGRTNIGRTRRYLASVWHRGSFISRTIRVFQLFLWIHASVWRLTESQNWSTSLRLSVRILYSVTYG
jgi:hypothetical protein